MKKSIVLLLALLISGSTMVGQATIKHQKKNKQQNMKHLNWTRNANIYEVNVRQYTPEGTLEAFREHLPRLKKMGVDILWLMPIFPVGEKNRKGSLGSYYAVKDYHGINPEFGTKDDFRKVVEEAHQLGMKVILDWVANHSAWDNVWAEQHPEYYEKDDKGNLVSPFDWTDVISFDYNNSEMREAMTEALKYWVRDFDVDGYRCDVAGMVPTDFWDNARRELDEIKPVFMLAEDEDNADLLRAAFDMNYSWKLHHLMNDIAQDKKSANDIWAYFDWNNSVFTPDMYRMTFTTNHDENSWNGTVKERMGDKAGEAFAVFTFVAPGFPLIYSGQEAGLDKRLRFFDKDTIDWSNLDKAAFYSKLINLKHHNHALWNGTAGGDLVPLSKGVNDHVFAFTRQKDDNSVVVIMNLSKESQSFKLDNHDIKGVYTDYKTGKPFHFNGKQHRWHLAPWEYVVLVR